MITFHNISKEDNPGGNANYIYMCNPFFWQTAKPEGRYLHSALIGAILNFNSWDAFEVIRESLFFNDPPPGEEDRGHSYISGAKKSHANYQMMQLLDDYALTGAVVLIKDLKDQWRMIGHPDAPAKIAVGEYSGASFEDLKHIDITVSWNTHKAAPFIELV